MKDALRYAWPALLIAMMWATSSYLFAGNGVPIASTLAGIASGVFLSTFMDAFSTKRTNRKDVA